MWLWALAVVLAINLYVLIFADPYLYVADQLPISTYGMILGASVYRDGSLSDVLRDRVDSALAMYKEWVFARFFVSWDDSEWHGEIRAIVAYLEEQWISKDIIVTDWAWFDTYDSMRRAKKVYKIDSMIIFTQAFHLSRSVYIARKLDIEAVWITTDSQSYERGNWFMVREAGARVKAFLDVEIFKSAPRYEQ